jgi:transcriptional regulator with XRE-family HTH domain
MNLHKLSELLTRRKKEFRMTDLEIAAKTGISRPYWIALRTGKNPKTNKPSRPSYDVVARLITALGLDFNDTMELAGYHPPDGIATGPSWVELMEIKSEDNTLPQSQQLEYLLEIQRPQYIVQCRKLVEQILNDTNPIKIRTLLSFLEWLNQVSDKTFNLQEPVSKELPSHELLEYVFDRDGRRCTRCGSDTGLLVISLFEGRRNDPDNYITLCEACSRANSKVSGR